MPKELSPYAEYVVQLLSPFGEITAKFMFGGYGIYKNGLIIGIIAEDELYFKVDDSNKANYEKLDSTPFVFEGKGKKMQMSYWKVPPEILENEEILPKYLQDSYDVSINSKIKIKKRKKKKSL
ncbi:MAG: TfoX/Sxy family protein [Rickettsiaceae bacterium]|nr:TfoX/Sxy family protein [Rickettsiaceae bacterium]